MIKACHRGIMFNPFQAIESAESESDPQIRQNLLEKAIQSLLSHRDVQSSDVQHAIGYAWYLLPANTEMRHKNVMHHLRNAVRINHSNKFARLYLGHHHYDRGQFDQALDIFSSFQQTDFLEVNQGWRDIKVSELILCCTLRLGDRGSLKETVYRFCESLTFCEDEMNPAPKELTETLLEITG
jgi:tetratricopeptide (TPR) repeat protein